MRWNRLAVHGVAILLAVAIKTNVTAGDERQKPIWIADAEQELLGTWENADPNAKSLPKLDILMDGPDLKVRFWGKTRPKISPYGPPDRLFVLSRNAAFGPIEDNEVVAFATHDSSFAIRHYVLKLRDNKLHLEGVVIYTDNSGRSNRHVEATFRKTSDASEEESDS
jgi:hypothetical protein